MLADDGGGAPARAGLLLALVEEAARKTEAKQAIIVEQQKRLHELAMESFGTITYSGSQFGELRSMLDPAPFSRARPQSAEASSPARAAVGAWPGGRPVAHLATVASTVDVVYASTAGAYFWQA